MIPKYDRNGNLPPGLHWATWSEIVRRYGYNDQRRKQLNGMKAALDNLKSAGCKRAYLDGSFITDKKWPCDYDLCWEPQSTDFDLLDSLFVLTRYVLPPRKEQKFKYFGDILITLSNPAVSDSLSYFQQDDRIGNKKGIIAIEVGKLP